MKTGKAMIGRRLSGRQLSRRRPPVPPDLPPGRVIGLPGRGEVFIRDSGGSPGDPAVLLLHGWTASADLNFLAVYRRLAKSYRVVALDLRGHGRGMRPAVPFSLEDCADDAAAAVRQLGAGPVIVVGYSMGGPVGMLLARRHPNLVAALVMQATALEWRTVRERAVWRLLLPAFRLGLWLGAGAGLLNLFVRRAAARSPDLDGYRPWLIAEFGRAKAGDLTAAGRALSRYDARPWAGQLGLPAVALVTTRDRLVGPAKQRELAAILHASVIEVDADHDLPLIRPAEYARQTRLAVDTAAALCSRPRAGQPIAADLLRPETKPLPQGSVMEEISVPVAYAVQPADNVTDDVINNEQRWPGAVGLRRRLHGAWTPVTWREFAGQVRELAAGFIAAGIRPGDRVALMSRTRYEWTALDYAIMSAGGVVVPIYPTSSAEQVEWILSDSGATAIVAETGEHATMIDEVRARCRGLGQVWLIDGTGPGTLDDLRARGADVTADQVEARRRSRAAADLAEIIYTSGTTGRPKGCMLSHGNLLSDTRNCMENDGFRKVFNETQSTLLFLPLAHSYAQLVQHGAVHTRTVLGLVDMAEAATELPAFKPTTILSVPRVWQKFYEGAKRQAVAEGHGRVFAMAERTAIRYSQALDAEGPGLLLRLQHAQFDRLVYRKLRAALGGAIRYAWSGAAPLDRRLGHFFRGCGISILEGYGLTETSPATNSNTLDRRKLGTVGRPIPGATIRIAADGEILVRGPMVFQGYWQDETATKEMIDSGGWLHTGDLGALDGEGFLTIVGRKKDLIITSSGKNVAPAVLEERLRTHWLVSDCLVVGDGRPFIAALVVGDHEAFARWKAENHKPAAASMADLADDPGLRAEFQQAVDHANEVVSRAEAIKKFALITDDFTEAGGQLTPTLKVRRDVVTGQYAAQIDALYDGS